MFTEPAPGSELGTAYLCGRRETSVTWLTHARFPVYLIQEASDGTLAGDGHPECVWTFAE